MNSPKFTAEASLYRTSGYCHIGTPDTLAGRREMRNPNQSVGVMHTALTTPGRADIVSAQLMGRPGMGIGNVCCESGDGYSRCCCKTKCVSTSKDCVCQDGLGNPSPDLVLF
jgi:hypothetical protein